MKIEIFVFVFLYITFISGKGIYRENKITVQTEVSVPLESDNAYNHSFTSGNLLFSNPNGYNPNEILEFDTSGNLVHNYSTWLENDPNQRCIARDLAFLNSDTLLLLDSQQGIFYSSSKGNVKGIWSNLLTNQPGVLGCDLQRFKVDQNNKKIYVISTNVKCDYSYIPGVFVYDLTGTFLKLITHDQFVDTWDVDADSDGNIWVTDTSSIFIFNSEGGVVTIDPVATKLGYNGILYSGKNTMYVTVPAQNNDLIIEIETDKVGKISQTINIVGNTTSNGSSSGIPGSMAINAKGDIIVEVPWASKSEGDKKSQVIQIYSSKGNYKSGFGGRSCKESNVLCVPMYGMVFIP